MLPTRIPILRVHVDTDVRFDRSVADPALDQWRHYLVAARRYRPHLLTEPEEKLFAEKAVTGRSAWVRMFTQVTDAITVDLDGEKATLEEALARLHLPDRAARQAAGRAITEALAPGLPVRTYIFNAVMSDHWLDDKLRHYRTWVEARNLGNEISDDTFAALVNAVTDRYDIPARWYRLKGRLLGIADQDEFDRYAPLAPKLDSPAALGAYIDRLNAEGVAVYRRLSPAVLIALMEIACKQLADYHAARDPFAMAPYGVSWAGEEKSANWFDTAREYTERWHHQQQIRLAVPRLGNARTGIMKREPQAPQLHG